MTITPPRRLRAHRGAAPSAQVARVSSVLEHVASAIGGGKDLGDSNDSRFDHMAGIDSKSFQGPDETRTPDKTRVDVVRLGDTEVGRFTFQPGWRWSECIKPVVGTESCQTDHVGYVASGRLGVEHQDGTQVTLSPVMLTASHPVTMPGSRATRSSSASNSRVPLPTRRANPDNRPRSRVHGSRPA